MEILVENNESEMAFFSLTPVIIDPGFVLFNAAWFSFNLVEQLFLFGAFSLNELKIQPLLPFGGQQKREENLVEDKYCLNCDPLHSWARFHYLIKRFKAFLEACRDIIHIFCS